VAYDTLAYTLQAIVGSIQIIGNLAVPRTSVVVLEQGLALLPLTEAANKTLGLGFLPLTDGGDADLPNAFVQFCSNASTEGRLAYLEAEFFGGAGTQACVLFERGSRKEGMLVSGSAINEALRFLGVVPNDDRDEFDSLRLGRHRDTHDWLRENAT
jgi:hypothetical protein